MENKNEANLSAAYEQQEQIKREHGRYTLEEAATFINERTGERAEGIKNKLIAAVKNWELVTYAPGSFVKNDSKVVRDFYDHVYWNSLNDWLEKNEPRLDCKFPNPAAKLLADLDDLDARDERRAAIRRKAGRCNFEEAAEMIAKGAGEVYEQILGKLVRAAESHALTSYMFGRNSPEEYGSERGQSMGVSEFHECSWEDLNKWLKENAPLINYEFPNPAVSPAAGKVEAVNGITKQLVINAFEGMHFDRDHWGKNLATPPDWLIGCRVAKGNKKTSATWNPVLIAVALTDPKRGISVNRLDAVFVGLKDWAVAWREASDYLR